MQSTYGSFDHSCRYIFQYILCFRIHRSSCLFRKLRLRASLDLHNERSVRKSVLDTCSDFRLRCSYLGVQRLAVVVFGLRHTHSETRSEPYVFSSPILLKTSCGLEASACEGAARGAWLVGSAVWLPT